MTTAMTAEQISQLSNTIFTARRDNKILDVYPGEPPATLEDAYAVQDLSIKASTDEITGWKIGMVPPDLREQLGSERIMGPTFKKVTHFIGRSHNDDECLQLPVFKDGFIAIEAELVLELAQDITPGSINTADGVDHLIKAVYAGIEIASSPIVDLNSYGPTAIVTDFGNQQGMVIGEKIENWQEAVKDMEAKTVINGELISAKPATNVLNGQLAALEYIINCAAKRNITLPAGSFVLSGATTGVHETIVGAKSTVSFGDMKLNIELVAI
jgi:2-keto-4-pentenoate hydratase